ncbi:MAG: beta-propeller domain-containing protein, methanol dehydrogenase [Cyanobacteria bacterium QS_6_48_18]|nr:MAG: beta-propeller domain-containing protein, methanol dehydrogenase [Cyanobacteria bacterium QS_6_48_18]
MTMRMRQLSMGFEFGKRFLQRLILTLLLLVLTTGGIAAPAHATSVDEMPQVNAGESSWVVDKAEVLSRINKGRLGSSLDNLAQQSGNEVRMVTIRHLDYDETIQSFTNGLFEKWFPTPEEQANQALLVLDTVSNNAAIRAGEGVKSLMGDEIAKSVVSDTIGAALRSGNQYNQAFLNASDRVVAVLSGQPDPGPPEEKDTMQVESTFTKAEDTDTENATTWIIGLLIAATIIPMATYFVYLALGR